MVIGNTESAAARSGQPIDLDPSRRIPQPSGRRRVDEASKGGGGTWKRPERRRSPPHGKAEEAPRRHAVRGTDKTGRNSGRQAICGPSLLARRNRSGRWTGGSLATRGALNLHQVRDRGSNPGDLVRPRLVDLSTGNDPQAGKPGRKVRRPRRASVKISESRAALGVVLARRAPERVAPWASVGQDVQQLVQRNLRAVELGEAGEPVAALPFAEGAVHSDDDIGELPQPLHGRSHVEQTRNIGNIALGHSLEDATAIWRLRCGQVFA